MPGAASRPRLGVLQGFGHEPDPNIDKNGTLRLRRDLEGAEHVSTGIDDPARADIEMPDLRIAHLPIGQADVEPRGVEPEDPALVRGRFHLRRELAEFPGDGHDRALNLDNLFDIQSEIAREVVVALHGILSDEEAERIEQKPTTSFAAYEEYSFGRQELAKRTGESLLRAKAHFEKAIELDPEYAQAWVGLATVLALPHYYGEKPESTYGELEKAIDTALAIDPLLGEAYAGLGLLSRYTGDLAEAEDNFLRAIELSPGYASAYLWYASLLRESGRLDEAIEFNRKAIELDPLSPVLRSGLVISLYGLGRAEEARAEALEGIEVVLACPGSGELAPDRSPPPPRSGAAAGFFQNGSETSWR